MKSQQILAYIKDDHRYIFLFDKESVADVKLMIGSFAGDPELTFSWHDALVLTQKLGKMNLNETP